MADCTAYLQEHTPSYGRGKEMRTAIIAGAFIIAGAINVNASYEAGTTILLLLIFSIMDIVDFIRGKN